MQIGCSQLVRFLELLQPQYVALSVLRVLVTSHLCWLFIQEERDISGLSGFWAWRKRNPQEGGQKTTVSRGNGNTSDEGGLQFDAA